MRRRLQEKLIESGQLCGAPVLVGGRLACRRFAGHGGGHSADFDRRPLTDAEKLERRRAKLSARGEHRAQRIESLVRRLHEQERQIERLRRSPGYRVQYRLVGGYFRLRRYFRFAAGRVRLAMEAVARRLP